MQGRQQDSNAYSVRICDQNAFMMLYYVEYNGKLHASKYKPYCMIYRIRVHSMALLSLIISIAYISVSKNILTSFP